MQANHETNIFMLFYAYLVILKLGNAIQYCLLCNGFTIKFCRSIFAIFLDFFRKKSFIKI